MELLSVSAKADAIPRETSTGRAFRRRCDASEWNRFSGLSTGPDARHGRRPGRVRP